jgi:hypothetical protein
MLMAEGVHREDNIDRVRKDCTVPTTLEHSIHCDIFNEENSPQTSITG